MGKHRSKAALALLFLLLGVFFYSLWAERPQEPDQAITQIDFVMDTVVEQRLYGDNAQQAAERVSQMLARLEGEMSLYVEESEIAQINAQAGIGMVPVSQETFDLLTRAKELCGQSQGLFDITIGPVSTLWNVTGASPQVPDDQAIQQAQSLVNWQDLLLDSQTRSVGLRRTGQSIDLGGIAKGYAVDLAWEIYEDCGINEGYLSVGGNILVLGTKPEGEDFDIGVRDPRGSASEYLGVVTVPNQIMATTGDYERYFIQDGVRYHHVMDPRTGAPCQSDLISVTVIGTDGTLCDFLSTVLFVAGKESAMELLDREDLSLILVDQEGHVYCSSNLKDRFIPREGSAYTYFYGSDATPLAEESAA